MKTEILTKKQLTGYVFTSKEEVATFIELFSYRHNVEIEMTELTLKQPGVKISRLPKK